MMDDKLFGLGVAAGAVAGAGAMLTGIIWVEIIEMAVPTVRSIPTTHDTVIIPGIDRCESFKVRTECHVSDTWDFIYVKKEK